MSITFVNKKHNIMRKKLIYVMALNRMYNYQPSDGPEILWMENFDLLHRLFKSQIWVPFLKK
ncbi:hypothetical protein ASZ90_017473 [hydrocarbon metagenome]|uniref:Uncharacterized protein n=1 Tax=hydrocarbon metagenome TaxID=938273 RepID=A0A0W8E975_9ZZZZ